MTRRAIAAALALLLAIVAGSTATPPGAPQPVPPSAWTVVEAQPEASASSPDPSPAAPSVEPVASVVTSVPDPAPGVAPSAAPGATRTGVASWYCSATSPCTKGYPASGLFAAAGPALRVGAWRGRVVTVNGLRVRLIDWCACPGRVVDLYSSAFLALGVPLSRGLVSVKVTW